MVDAIKVKKRDSGLALGANLDDYREVGWNSTANGFKDVLSLLQQEYGGEKSKKSKNKKDRGKSKKAVPIIQVGMK